jgi:hypothetical protein
MLEFILWVIFIYFVGMLIWRYVVPFLLKRYVRRMERRFGQMQDEDRSYAEGRKKGDVHIHQMPPEKRHRENQQQELEYTDFEEINDDNEPK